MPKKIPWRTGYNPGKPIPRGPRKKKPVPKKSKKPEQTESQSPLTGIEPPEEAKSSSLNPPSSTSPDTLHDPKSSNLLPAVPEKEKPEKKQGMRTVRKVAKDAYSCITQLNKNIIEKAKEIGIKPESDDVSDLSAALRAGSVDAAGKLGARNSKVLNAVYTLLEDNIEAIMCTGIMMALNGNKEMVKYYLDMYTPKAPVKDGWDQGQGPTNNTTIQQIMFIKMMKDVSGMTMEDMKKLVEEKTKEITKEDKSKAIDAEVLIKSFIPEEPPSEE